MQGASWQRCRVHFMRNALSLLPKATQQMVGATIRTVFAQPDAESAGEQWRRVADGFLPRFPKLAELMDGAEEDVLAYAVFPVEHFGERLRADAASPINYSVFWRHHRTCGRVYLVVYVLGLCRDV
jgi:putative transposase